MIDADHARDFIERTIRERGLDPARFERAVAAFVRFIMAHDERDRGAALCRDNADHFLAIREPVR